MHRVGPFLGRLTLYAMMGRRPKPVTTAKEHIKFIKIGLITRGRYLAAIRNFSQFLRYTYPKRPRSIRRLRAAAGEYINFLYQDDRPLYWAGNFLSGMKKFHPETLPALSTAQVYYRDWSKSIIRTKAFPYTLDMVLGMSSVLVSEGKPRFAALVLLAFCGLFRLGELISLRMHMIDVVSKSFCLVTLPDSKARTGPVSVIIRDETLIKVLSRLVASSPPEQRFFPGTYRDISLWLRKFAFFLKMPGDRFTGHGFRRGGAAHAFRTTGSLDRVQVLGRWACARTCKSYIDEALSERADLALPVASREFLNRAIAAFPEAMRQVG